MMQGEYMIDTNEQELDVFSAVTHDDLSSDEIELVGITKYPVYIEVIQSGFEHSNILEFKDFASIKNFLRLRSYLKSELRKKRENGEKLLPMSRIRLYF